MQYENLYRASVKGILVGNWIAGAIFYLLSLELCVCLSVQVTVKGPEELHAVLFEGWSSFSRWLSADYRP